jgi:hypothetical protein
MIPSRGRDTTSLDRFQFQSSTLCTRRGSVGRSRDSSQLLSSSSSSQPKQTLRRRSNPTVVPLLPSVIFSRKAYSTERKPGSSIWRLEIMFTWKQKARVVAIFAKALHCSCRKRGGCFYPLFWHMARIDGDTPLVFLARVATDTVVQELYSSSSGVSPFLEMAPKGSPSFFVVRARFFLPIIISLR